MSLETKGLPANIEAERWVLGGVLLGGPPQFEIANAVLKPDDFSLEKHRRIYGRMGDLYTRGEHIDRVTVYNELRKWGEAESCDGLSYLVSLDDGLPQQFNLAGYVRILEEKALLRRGIFAAQHLMNRCLAAEESAGDILRDCQRAIEALGEGATKHGDWITPTDVVRRYPGGAHGFVSRKQGGVGIPTPWSPTTEILGGGLHPGELFVLAGRPGMGKSLAAMQIAHWGAKHGHGAAVFSLEMSRESLTERLLCGIARVDSHKLRAGYLDATEKGRLLSAATDLEELPLWIDDTRARTIPAISAALRKLRAKNPIALVVIDHLQLMVSGRHRDQRNQEMAEILHELKHEAAKSDICVIAVSQLNRQCEIENRQPQLSDLAETGAAEQDADVVLFVHRPERYAKNHAREDLKGHAEFIIAKQRCGPVGCNRMIFLGGIQRFETPAEEYRED